MSGGDLEELSRRLSQLGNGLPKRRSVPVDKGENYGNCGEDRDGGRDSKKKRAVTNEFTILNAHAEHLTLQHLSSNDTNGVDIVTSKSYYETLEGHHLQEFLNYYYTLRSLRRRGVVKPTAVSVPSYSRILGCAIQFHPSFRTAHGTTTTTTTTITT